MFYSQFILAKKGPLGTIWIAAHLERKLRKNQVADTDIGVSVDSILFPEVPIALRLSSHLLLGVVRIYSKKVNYLFDDCSDALLKVKQAFRSTAVDLPPEQSKAPYHSITLPETFDLDDFELPDNDIFQGNFVDHHVSTREQITLQDNMEGVTFTTSQFGPDERFGDGDASQIGLDLDEELFMDKGDAAGTSGILVETDAGPQESTKESSPFKDDDDHNEGISDPPLASNTNNYIIQAPSTPGLTEEPNLPSAKEEIQVSDDHMDEAAKETASSPVEPSDVGGTELHSNGNVHSMNELDDEKEKTLGTETMEFISSGLPQPATFDKHTEATNGQDDAENQIIIAADVESRGCCDVDEIGTIATAVPVPEDGLEAQGCESYAGCSKTDLNGIDNHHPLHDCEAEYNKSFVGPAVLGTVDVVTSASEHQNFLNLKNAETSESNIDEKSSGFATPVLQACSTKVLNACGSKLPGQEDGLNSAVISEREDATDVAGISTTDRDVEEPTSKADQIAHGVTCATDSNIGEQSDNLIAEENHIEKENNLQISDFPPTEVLLSMPNLPAGVSGNIFVDSTPGNEFFAKDDDIDENVLSGRKRSFAESTLTIQSLNSVESSGGAQSKGTVESVPDDNDLLSSILVGRRSTTFIMKPTPPIPDTVRAKRQQTAARSLTHKRKVLVDDSTVLHGDTIRQQLTDTEDIRRVRKKAPCTKLEVWMLQKQFLEDGVFTEPVFTGMFPVLRSLDDEAIDLNGITIYRDEGTKGASEADISIKSVRGEETEDLGTVVPSNADISRSKLDEETEPMGTLVPSIAAGEGGGILLETSFEQESASVVDGSSMLKEVEIVVNEVTKQMSPHDVSVEKADMKVDDVRSPVGGEAIHSVTLEAVPVSAPDVNCKSTEDTIDCSPSLNKSSDVIIPMHIDASGEVLDQRCAADCTIGDASTAEGVSGSGIRDIGVDVGVSGNVDLDERSGGEHLMEKREGVDSSIEMRDFQDTCSLAVQNSTVSESLALEDTACLISDQAVDNSHPDELGTTNKNDTSGSGLKVDGSCLSSNIICEDVKVDLSHSVEADLSSRVTTSNEREGLQYWEADLNIVTDSTSIPSEYIDTGNNAEFGTDAIEHDTDFLNVDDDDVAEDYESDMPNPEEKRILDNSGWSSRTRAVANYLQVLFEKESDQAKKAISLDSLLVGKTRKEASRMFFETLVLKTKDYVQAEQETAFYDIKINPRGKLLKSEF
ncbi:sister chromatid cohesion 1 protein 4-like [Chenopodium quinoa]|uniref:sister chromatid cohesion 1 protein 4-like n=1 Tax=Chenopodium quinoa TaxID=63459 RepID=UPI000B781068|nr:sister chromatid cohesion 1 protein 4-like [Chenopodium quinoa]